MCGPETLPPCITAYLPNIILLLGSRILWPIFSPKFCMAERRSLNLRSLIPGCCRGDGQFLERMATSPPQVTKSPSKYFKTPIQTIGILLRNYAILWGLARKATTLKGGENLMELSRYSVKTAHTRASLSMKKSSTRVHGGSQLKSHRPILSKIENPIPNFALSWDQVQTCPLLVQICMSPDHGPIGEGGHYETLLGPKEHLTGWPPPHPQGKPKWTKLPLAFVNPFDHECSN